MLVGWCLVFGVCGLGFGVWGCGFGVGDCANFKPEEEEAADEGGGELEVNDIEEGVGLQRACSCCRRIRLQLRVEQRAASGRRYLDET